MAVLGVKELKKDLRDVKKAVKNATRRAALAGANAYRDALRASAPTTKTTPKKAIISKRKQSAQDGTGIGQVGTKGPAFYLLILNSGAKAHDLVAGEMTKVISPNTRKRTGQRLKKKKVLVASRRPGLKPLKGQFLGPRVRHPGLGGRRWIRPVLDFTTPKALDAVAEKYTDAIKKATA